MSKPRRVILIPICILSLLISCSPGSGEKTANAGSSERLTVLSEWVLKSTPAADISKAVASSQHPIRVETAWLKCTNDSLHILLLAPGLSKYLSSEGAPTIFFSLYLDTDSSDATGSRSTALTPEALPGFEWSLDFSTMQARDKYQISSVLNCQVSKWGDGQFSGDLSWGTRFNRSMKASNQKDYAEFSVPGSVFPLCPSKGAVRLAFAVPEATYASGGSRVLEYRLEARR